MGEDKALLTIAGSPMVRRVAAALRAAGADDVTISANRRNRGAVEEAVAGIEALVVEDEVPDSGPLEGIITALRHSRHDVTLIVSCDLLHPSPEAFRKLVGHEADVVVPVVDGHRQWLHAAWHQRATVHLQVLFDAGERAIRRAVEGLDVVWVHDLAPKALADADTPSDLLNAGVETGTSLPSDEHP